MGAMKALVQKRMNFVKNPDLVPHELEWRRAQQIEL